MSTTKPSHHSPVATPASAARVKPGHITPLPAELKPERSSTELILTHVERLRSAGVPQKVIGLSLGFGANFVSMLKKGDDLPLPRVIAFAKAAGLSPQERSELLHARIMELHGGRGDFDVEALSTWGAELFGPAGDEGVLVELWREVAGPAPHLVSGLLEDPKVRARVRETLNAVVQEVFREAAEQNLEP